jgi:hypothetical protein
MPGVVRASAGSRAKSKQASRKGQPGSKEARKQASKQASLASQELAASKPGSNKI